MERPSGLKHPVRGTVNVQVNAGTRSFSALLRQLRR